MVQLTRSGISVFGEGKKLPEGEDLVEVIKRSNLSIPIISKGYASSESCLVELGLMLECRRTNGQTIIPIFYDVDPSDVRLVRGSFEISLKEHEMKGMDGRTIDAWGRDLREVGDRDRFYSADNNSWSNYKLLKQILLDVLQLFSKWDVKENLVGIQDRVQEVLTKLGVCYKEGQAVGLHGGDVRVVGIYGTGGVGKTTIAKVVYKAITSLFDGCSYLEDIRERFTQSEGLKSLQNQLISDLLKQSCPMFTCEEGAHIIRHRFHSMRVLIILDDVSHYHQLEPFIGKLSWFGPRSRIIVTTCDCGLIDIPEVAEKYEVEPLKPDQALFLFQRHASHVLQFPDRYDSLFDEIISVTGQIPLAIEVLAPLLCRAPSTLWQHTLKIMRKHGDPVERMLMASFEFLNYETKEILLDIACFFVGKDIANPFSMWCACGYDPLSGIKVLLDMSLVQIGENNKLWMHDQLRNLCQQIIKNEDPERPERRSRLWDHVDAVSMLKERKGTKRVQALDLKYDNICHDCFTCEEFELLPGLRYLNMGKARIIGDSKNSLSNLRWLDWQVCPETFGACDLHLKELVILDLSWSKVAHNWKGWSQIKMPQLRILNLTGCTDLLITPDFSGFEKLEILILEHCSQLVKIDASIAHLKFLVTLNLKFCSELSMLPKELNDMKEMKELLIDGTSIKEIPSTLANMKKLKILSASNCFSLSGLPQSLGQLEALSVLLLDSAKIVELPDSIGELVQLKQISLRNCRRLGELPDSIGNLGRSLIELDVSGTGICNLPGSITNLQGLKVLKMDFCFTREFPCDFGRLTNLEEMHALQCRSLEGDIPSHIGELTSLRMLVLGYTRISSLPPCIQSLCCLQTLDLLNCDRIEALPILPSSLTRLRVISRSMKAVPFIDNLTKLEELCLGDEDPEELKLPSTQRVMNSILTRGVVLSFLWPKRFLRLKVLELSHSRITDLRLRDKCLPQLTKLVVSGANLRRIQQLPSTLSFLSVRGCLSLKRLPTVQCLKSLNELRLSHSAVREVEGLGELGALEIIDISHCEIRNLEGLGQLTSLISLTLSDCDHLRKLPNISNLKMLKILDIRRCREIKNIQGLQEIRSSLGKLHVGEGKDEDSQQAMENKDPQGHCYAAPPPQCRQPEKPTEYERLLHGQVQAQQIVLGHEPSPPQGQSPEPAIVLDNCSGETAVELPHFLHLSWSPSGSTSPFSPSASACSPSAPPQAEEEEQVDAAKDEGLEEQEGQEVEEVEEEEEEHEQSLDDVYSQVKRNKSDIKPASGEILLEPSASVNPAILHFEEDDSVESCWLATRRERKGEAQGDKSTMTKKVGEQIKLLDEQQIKLSDEQIKLCDEQIKLLDEQLIKLRDEQIKLRYEQIKFLEEQQIKLRDKLREEQIELLDERIELLDERMELRDKQQIKLGDEQRIKLRDEQIKLLDEQKIKLRDEQIKLREEQWIKLRDKQRIKLLDEQPITLCDEPIKLLEEQQIKLLEEQQIKLRDKLRDKRIELLNKRIQLLDERIQLRDEQRIKLGDEQRIKLGDQRIKLRDELRDEQRIKLRDEQQIKLRNEQVKQVKLLREQIILAEQIRKSNREVREKRTVGGVAPHSKEG